MFQKRWNSSETPKQPEANTSASEKTEEKNPNAVKDEEEITRETVSETRTTEMAESKNPDVAAAEEDNAQVVSDAVHAMGAAAIRSEEATNGEAVKVQQQDESQVAEQERDPVMDAVAGNLGETTSANGEPSAESLSRDRIQRKKAERAALLDNEPTPKATVYVGNLFYDITAEDLRTAMERYGIVENCIIIFDQRGISKG